MSKASKRTVAERFTRPSGRPITQAQITWDKNHPAINIRLPMLEFLRLQKLSQAGFTYPYLLMRAVVLQESESADENINIKEKEVTQMSGKKLSSTTAKNRYDMCRKALQEFLKEITGDTSPKPMQVREARLKTVEALKDYYTASVVKTVTRDIVVEMGFPEVSLHKNLLQPKQLTTTDILVADIKICEKAIQLIADRLTHIESELGIK